MARNIHISSGDMDFHVDVNITDFTEEITEAIQAAIQRALVRIGGEVVSYAGDLIHNVTGNLRRSLSYYVDGNTVYVGTDCEYATYVEMGTSRSKAKPYLRPAAADHVEQWCKTVKDELENGL